MAIPYGIATEIEKSCFFQLFFLGGDVWRYRTVSPQKLKNLVFFNFFFWWRSVAIPYGIATEIEKSCFFHFFFLVAMCGDTVSPQKLKNLVFFKFFFGWRCFFHENMSSGHRLVMLEGLDWNKTTHIFFGLVKPSEFPDVLCKFWNRACVFHDFLRGRKKPLCFLKNHV